MLQEMKVFTIDALTSNSMKSPNPHSGIHETQVAKCLDTMCLDPSCNQGGHIVMVYDGSSITCPNNWNNPKPGDPCYALHTDSRNYVVIAQETNKENTVCYRKKAHPQNADEGQGYERTDIADTLNVFDTGECRTPILIVSEKPVICIEGNGARPSHMVNGYSEGGAMYTLNTIEQHSVCYSVDCRNLCMNEEKSGTLQAKNHGGFSYNYLNPVLMEKNK